MLSILIPTYNQDIRLLVKTLYQQVLQANIPFEIRIYDDGSEAKWKLLNSSIQPSANIIYKTLPQNLGRSAIRNKLAEEAIYANLLFLDDDALIIRSNFIDVYGHTLKQYDVVVGGRSYSQEKPIRSKRLHWKYGIKKEQNSKKAFHSNNFLIRRDVFNQIRFNEAIKGYGHEDTLFGWELCKAGYSITYIDNPVQPTGLECCEDFIQKQAQAAANLAQINKLYPGLETSLIKIALKLRNKFYLSFLILLLNGLEKPILFFLKKGIHSLSLLNMYKLSIFLRKQRTIRKGFQN